MSDQMPDEVWLDEDTINGEFYASPQQAMVTDVRYIRADLYEQAEAERDRIQSSLDAANRQCDRVKDHWLEEIRQRDRLRAERDEREAGSRDAIQSLYAEVEKLRAVLADIADNPYDYQRVQDRAQEALDHD